MQSNVFGVVFAPMKKKKKMKSDLSCAACYEMQIKFVIID